MNAYTINQQLDSLYKDLEAAHNNDERNTMIIIVRKCWFNININRSGYDALCRVQGISRYA